MLATIDQFKARYGITSTTDDAAITAVLQAVSVMLAGPTGANRISTHGACLEKVTLTERLTIDRWADRIFLAAFPVVSVTSVKELIFGQDPATVDSLVADVDYMIEKDRGIIYRLGCWLPGIRGVEVVYTGGYAAAGATPGAGETAMPADITEACLQQAGFVWNRRAQIGTLTQGIGSASVSLQQVDMLPTVKTIMDAYKRIV